MKFNFKSIILFILLLLSNSSKVLSQKLQHRYKLYYSYRTIDTSIFQVLSVDSAYDKNLCCINGVILNCMGEPIEDMRIMAYTKDGNPSGSSRSDSNGRFRLFPLRPDGYKVSIEGNDCLKFETTMELGKGMNYTVKVKLVRRSGARAELWFASKKPSRRKIRLHKMKRMNDCRCNT